MPRATVREPKAVQELVRLAYYQTGNLAEACRQTGVPIDRAENWKRFQHWDNKLKPATAIATIDKKIRAITDNAQDVLAKRKTQSALHLTKYLVDAGKTLVRSKGKLKNARTFKDLVAGRSGLYPEQQNTSNIVNLAVLVGGEEPKRIKGREIISDSE